MGNDPSRQLPRERLIRRLRESTQTTQFSPTTPTPTVQSTLPGQQVNNPTNPSVPPELAQPTNTHSAYNQPHQLPSTTNLQYTEYVIVEHPLTNTLNSTLSGEQVNNATNPSVRPALAQPTNTNGAYNQLPPQLPPRTECTDFVAVEHRPTNAINSNKSDTAHSMGVTRTNASAVNQPKTPTPRFQKSPSVNNATASSITFGGVALNSKQPQSNKFDTAHSMGVTRTNASAVNQPKTPTPRFQKLIALNSNKPQSAQYRGTDPEAAFNCPRCELRFTGDIYQCRAGHSACAQCRSHPCQHCGLQIGDMKNYLLQDIVMARKVPCLNADDGCRKIICMSDLHTHMLECLYGEIKCPYNICSGCSWKGKLRQLMQHFRDHHPANCQGEVNKEMILGDYDGRVVPWNSSRPSWVVQLVALGAHHFLVHVRVLDADSVRMAVQLLGPRPAADAWTYEIHVYNKAEPRRKYLYVDGCRSLEDSMEGILSGGPCAVLPQAYALTMRHRCAITWKFFVRKEGNDVEERGRQVVKTTRRPRVRGTSAPSIAQ